MPADTLLAVLLGLAAMLVLWVQVSMSRLDDEWSAIADSEDFGPRR